MTQATAGNDNRWLFGPVPDLLLGCGLAYVVVFAVQAAAGPAMREALPYHLAPFLTLLLGTPHYGATLLRVYAHAQDRQRYALVAVHATVLLALLFAAGLHVAWLGSFLITLYFSWSPWHYSGQNYGVAVMFLRRRGIPLDPLTKRLLYGTFLLSFVLVFLSFHGVSKATHQVPASFQGTIYQFLSLGIPDGVRTPLAALAAAGYLGCLVVGVARLLRMARLGDLAPALLLIAIQALWFLIPGAAAWWQTLRGLDPFSPEHRAYAFLWVATGHFVQYLWISTWYSQATDGGGRARYLMKTLLAGAALWTVPTMLFAPGMLGRLPYDFGLSLLASSMVNLHHFVLDGVIWKLRDGPVARVLLRPVQEAPPADPDGRTGWLAGLGWGVGLAVLALSAFGRVETYLGDRAGARGDSARFAQAAERRVWLGLDSPRTRVSLAHNAAQRGNVAAAEAELAKSLALFPTAEAHVRRGELYEQSGRHELALGEYRAALTIAPDDATALYRLGVLQLAQGDVAGARDALERAAAIAPENKLIALQLERASKPGRAPDETRRSNAEADPAPGMEELGLPEETPDGLEGRSPY